MKWSTGLLSAVLADIVAISIRRDSMLTLIYFICSVLVGCLAIGQRGGFAVFFVLAVGLTPIVALGMLVLTAPGVVTRGRRRDDACCECRSYRRR